jgi:uncharacterized protein
MKIEHKTISFKMDESEEEGVFKGIGSGFGDVDQGGDIMLSTCFDECLSKKKPNQIKCLWQHNQKEPLGYYRSLIPTPDGLEVEGKIFSTTLGKDALVLMKGDELGNGVDGLSIGFRIKDFKYEDRDGVRVRVIYKADLVEISIVTFPMHLRCRVGDVKNMTIEDIEQLNTLPEMEDFLKELGVSQRGAKAFIGKITELKQLSINESESQDANKSNDRDDQSTDHTCSNENCSKNEESSETHENKDNDDIVELSKLLESCTNEIKKVLK